MYGQAGYDARGPTADAAQLGITKKQLDNAVCLGRVNLRSKLSKAAREL